MCWFRLRANFPLEFFGTDLVLFCTKRTTLGCRVGDTLLPRPSSLVSWSVDLEESFLTTSLFCRGAGRALKLREDLGLTGEGVASSEGTEGGGIRSVTW